MTAPAIRMPVAGVLFDYGDTLIAIERPEAALLEAYTRISELLRHAGFAAPDGDALLGAVHDRVDTEFARHQSSGALEEIDLVAVADRAYASLGLALRSELLDEVLRIEQEAWLQGVTLDPEAVPTITALRAAGFLVGLCSNAPYRAASMHAQLDHLGLRAHLDAVTFSGEVGWRKPSERIFQAALAALGVEAGDALMVGDSLREDVLGAQAAGLQAVHLVRSPEGAPSATTIATLPALLDLLGVAASDAEEHAALRR